jgi:hypothetical protein
MARDRGLSRVAQLVRAGLATRPLRRLQGAWGASALGSWMFFVALAVYAYRAGGPTAGARCSRRP